MSKLPQISGRECISALQRAEFVFHTQTGNHVTLKNEVTGKRATVPMHRTIKPGTLRSIIRQLGLSVDEFIDLL